MTGTMYQKWYDVPMTIRYDVPVMECDECGHKWLQEAKELPKRCPSRKCRSLKWNTGKAGEIKIIAPMKESAIPIVKSASAIDETPKSLAKCPNPKHSGFERSDGYWCMECRRLFR